MYTPAAQLQSEKGGPEISVIDIKGRGYRRCGSRKAGREKYTLRADDAQPYHEGGNFGVC